MWRRQGILEQCISILSGIFYRKRHFSTKQKANVSSNSHLKDLLSQPGLEPGQTSHARYADHYTTETSVK